jgi:polysaccharide transporter, PST family
MPPESHRFTSPVPDGPPAWRTMAGNSFWLVLEKLVRWIVGMTVGVWLARYLGPHDFGLFNATLAWVALFAGAAGFGIEAIVVRELVRRPAERFAILTTAISLRGFGGILAAGTAVFSAAIWPTVSPPVGLTAIAALITLFSLSEAIDLWFQAHLQARTAALARTGAFVVSTVVRIVLILQAAPVAAFLWLAAAEAVLISGLLGVILMKRIGGTVRPFSPQIAQALIRESWPNIIANLAGMAYLRADRVMLASMAGESAAGIYSAAANLVEVWYIVPMAVMNSATPILTRLHTSDPACFQRDLWRLARLHAMAAWGLAIVLAASAPWLVPMLFGPAYVPAIPVLALLAGAMPFVFLGVVASPWYLNQGLTLAAMRRHLCGGVLNIILNFLLIPQWGAAGAAAATVASLAIAHVFANSLDPRTRPVFYLQWRALCLRQSPPSP